MKKIILILMTIFFSALAVYSLVHIIFWFIDNKHTDNLTESIIEDVIEDEIVIDPKTKKEVKVKKVNVNKLKVKNEDSKGWLEVKGTNINYPFVQTKDNKYYLTHSYDKKTSTAGWVFLDYRNDINNLDKNTIIYGHARLDGTMFGTLKKTINSSWYNNKNNHIIKVTTDKYEYEFQTFSNYHIKTENYYIQTKFSSDEEFVNFVNKLKKRSVHNYKVNLTKDDYILTLSTCYQENKKIVLHAKLISKKEKTKKE